jgi:hypothetical protein
VKSVLGWILFVVEVQGEGRVGPANREASTRRFRPACAPHVPHNLFAALVGAPETTKPASKAGFVK